MPLSWHRRAPRAPRRTQPLQKEGHRGRAARAAAGLAARRDPPTSSPKRTRPGSSRRARTPTPPRSSTTPPRRSPRPIPTRPVPTHPTPFPPLSPRGATLRARPSAQPASLTGAAPPARPGAGNPEPPAPPPAPRRSNQQQDGGRRGGGPQGRAVIATAPSNTRPAALCGNQQPSPSRRGRSGRVDRSEQTSVKPKTAPPLSERGPPPDGRAR